MPSAMPRCPQARGDLELLVRQKLALESYEDLPVNVVVELMLPLSTATIV